MFFWGILVFNALAQAPEGIVYQAEARDNSGELYQNTSLDVKISILKDYAQGELVWIGNHQVTTNNYGMFVLVIGTGTNDAGYVFDDIAWGKFPHFLNVQVKKSESETWIDMGTEQFLSVPYVITSYSIHYTKLYDDGFTNGIYHAAKQAFTNMNRCNTTRTFYGVSFFNFFRRP